jgi:TatD DNase family protein
MIRWTDQHCHLGSLKPTDAAAPAIDGAVAADFEQAALLVDDAAAAGVARLIDVGTDVANSRAAAARAAHFAEVWSTAGVHPHDASGGVAGLAEVLDLPGVVGVGECGLDYHYLHSPKEDQRTVFAEQIRISLQRDLPLVIHTREAWDETFEILAEVGVPRRLVMHCFTGGPPELRRCLDIGAFVSFSGIVTFPSATEVAEAAVLCPADRLLVETDSPYLAPVPERGRRNRPALVAVVGEFIAERRGVAVAEVAEQTWQNAAELYGLDV